MDNTYINTALTRPTVSFGRVGGTLFLGMFDYLIENIVFDAQGHVTCQEHSRVLERMIDLREENETLKKMLKSSSRVKHKKF
jgi:hypothetical protein